MTSKLIVNSLAADTGVSTITFADQAKMGNSIFHSTGFTIGDSFLHSTGVNLTNINATGVITATKFVGEVSVGSSITFEDNEKAYFGTGTDFSIYHNGSASYLDETGDGGLIVKTNTAFQVFNSAGSQAAFTVTPGGSVQLYHNNIIRAETTASGFQVTNGALDIVNNGGSGASLRNYSAGVFFLGNAAQGDFALYCQDNTNNSIILQANSGEKYVECNMGGSVDLYHHNDGIKLSTTASGLTLNGIVNGPTQLNLSSTGGDLINLTSTNAASRSTIKFNTNGNDWEIGARGSTADNPNNFYIFDSASTSYRLLIDSDGAAFFKGVSAGAKGTINLESQDPFIRLYDTNGEANKRKWDIRNIGQSGYNELDFRTINDANNSFNSVMQIEHGGDVNISDGNLRVASGHGIDFSATAGPTQGSGSSELLEDYEEGTWTPLVRNSSGTGTAGSANYGYYTKVGNVVHACATVHWTALNSGTTSVYALVVGFPYVTKNSTNYRCQHILGAQVVGVQAGGAGYNLSLAFDGNLSAAYLLGVNSASTGGSNYTHTPTINSSGTIYGLSITYLTD